MPTPHSPKITILKEVYPILEAIIKSTKSQKRLFDRANFILRMGQNKPNRQIAKEFSVQAKTVRKWRMRWLAGEEILKSMVEREAEQTERQQLKDLTAQVKLILSDEPRPGVSPTYTPEQYCRILEVALEEPSKSGRPINHWSNRELAEEVNKRGICENISISEVARFLKRSGYKTA